jgi:hypothetical protein
MSALLTVLPYLIGLGLVCVVLVLLAGLVTMTKGGEFNARYGNKLMQLRVATQAGTVALILLYLLIMHMS